MISTKGTREAKRYVFSWDIKMIYILFHYNPNPPNSVMGLCSSLSSFCGGSTHIFQETNRVCDLSSLTIQAATLHLPGRTQCALSFRVSTGQERIPKEESAQNVDPGEEISLAAAPAGTRTCDFSITSPELYHWVTTSPPPSPLLLILGKYPLPRGEIEPASEVHWNRRSNNWATIPPK